MPDRKRFNPRSREGSDLAPSGVGSMRASFNPRSREGSDLADWLDDEVPIVSIHAPARGATPYV